MRASEYEKSKTCLADDWLKAVLSDSVTAREAHLCGERGSPAASKGMVCLRIGYAPQGGGKCGKPHLMDKGLGNASKIENDY